MLARLFQGAKELHGSDLPYFGRLQKGRGGGGGGSANCVRTLLSRGNLLLYLGKKHETRENTCSDRRYRQWRPVINQNWCENLPHGDRTVKPITGIRTTATG